MSESQTLVEWITERARLLGADADPVAWAIFKRKLQNTRLRVLRAIVDGQSVNLVQMGGTR